MAWTARASATPWGDSMIAIRILATLALLWVMFVEGLGLDFRSLGAVLRKPLFLLRAVLVVDVLVPLAAWILIVGIRPDSRVAAAVALVAACPIAPLALRRTRGAVGQVELVGAIHLCLGILSIVTTPVTLALLATALGYAARVPAGEVARGVFLALVLPLAAGLAVGTWWPTFASGLRRLGGRVALAILALVFLLVLFSQARALADVGIRGFAAMSAFVTAALAIGHFAGSRDPRVRPIFAMEAASRNLGLAFFIAASVLGQRAALPFLVPYVVVFLFVTSIYLRVVRSRGHETARQD